MPLYPPPTFVEHPADLVIDAFGTFLGKRSERMVVRWREPRVGRDAHDLREPTGDAEAISPGKPITADLPTRDGGLVPEQDGTTPTAEAPSPSSGDSDGGGGPQLRVFREVPAAGAPVAHPRAESDEPGRLGNLPHGSESGEASRKRAADRVAARLIGLWARNNPAAQSARSSPGSKMAAQLDRIADRPQSDANIDSGAEWHEQTVPMSRLRSVTISGNGVTVSSDLIAALVQRGIGLSFLTGHGTPVAQLSAPGLGGTVQTRRSQLAAYNSSLGVRLAVEFIRGKLRNQKHQLKYSGKYLKGAEPARFERLNKKIAAIDNLRKQLASFEADDLECVRDRLMGHEGTGARVYWEGVAIILEGKAEFPGRRTRGAIDPINSALNYGYGILYSQVSAAVVNAGLEMYAGFLHVDRPGKPALVLDLVEEFRAPLVDRAVLAIANQGITLETDAHGLTALSRKVVADRVLERLATVVPYEGKRWPLGSVIQSQARHLAVAVRGEREYRSFASRW